jgi:LCP family protein required for cell wall assembly
VATSVPDRGRHQPQTPASRPQRPRKRPHYWFRRLALLLALLLPLAGWRTWTNLRDHLPLKAAGNAPRMVAGQPVYVAVMGVDERAHDVGRSDTLMLLRLDPGTDALSIVNIPRDTRVSFPSGRRSKINAAYSAGGAEFVTEVISHAFGVPRPYYVTMNFQAFVQIVDQLGGVEMTVDKHYVYDDPYQDLHINIPAGAQKMDGKTALEFVRLRYDGVTNSDIARIGRQQQFMQALRQVLLSPSALLKVRSLSDTMRHNIQTNLPEGDQLQLAAALFKARNHVAMQTLPGTPDDATGDWQLDQAKWNEVTHAWKAN